jgi:peptidoglycan/LPS O-acetylase OafA/YrhL
MLRTNPEARHENAAPDPDKGARDRTSSRHYHGLDLLRSVALLLGVTFHAAMPVLTPEYLGLGHQDKLAEFPAAPILGVFMDWTHIWRMPAFFLLAGFFAQMVLMRKGPMAFLVDRTVRILGVLVTFCILFAMLSGGSPFERTPPPRAAFAGCLNGRKAWAYVMRFQLHANRVICSRGCWPSSSLV